MPDPTHTEPPQTHKPPGLAAIWLGILAVAVLWCLIPLWETAFINGGVPGIYWWFLAGNVALGTIGILIAVAALAEAVMVVLLVTRKPARPDKATRDELGNSCAIGFMVLLLLFARAGIAGLVFTPVLDQHMDTIETGEHRYFLAHHTAARASGEWYSFVQCDAMGVWCAQLHDIRTGGTQNGSVVTPLAYLDYDNETHAIQVIEDGETYFTYQLDLNGK